MTKEQGFYRGIPVYSLLFCNLGFVLTGWHLAVVLFIFGLAGNLCNISINTQAVAVEQWYGRQIMASFHGSWSLAGFTGALTGMVLINLKLVPLEHFIIIASVVLLNLLVNRPFLMGPPLIGYISQAFGLRYSFALIGILSTGITFLVSRIKVLSQTA